MSRQMGEPLSDEEVGELFRSPMTSTTETEAAIRLRFEVTRARREESRLRALLAEPAPNAALLARIESACGLPDPGEACRTVLALCREARCAEPAPAAKMCEDCDGAGYLAYPTYERKCEACAGTGYAQPAPAADVPDSCRVDEDGCCVVCGRDVMGCYACSHAAGKPAPASFRREYLGRWVDNPADTPAPAADAVAEAAEALRALDDWWPKHGKSAQRHPQEIAVVAKLRALLIALGVGV